MKMTADTEAFSELQETAFTSEEENELKARLFTLLAKQARLHTQGDHSSLREEDAAELLDSLVFTLRYALFLRGMPLRALLSADLQEMLKAGQAALQTCKEETQTLYLKARLGVEWYGNLALKDTLKGIGLFFRGYDSRLYAHRIPAFIDYPLCAPVNERLRGVLYVQAYLKQLLAENELTTRFAPNRVASLLYRASPEYKDLFINLYEPVAADAVGLVLLGRDIKQLEITRAQAVQIHEQLSALPGTAVRRRTADAAKTVCRTLGLLNAQAGACLEQAAEALLPRICLSPESACGVFSARLQSMD
jgi:hypothetical protein